MATRSGVGDDQEDGNDSAGVEEQNEEDTLSGDNNQQNNDQDLGSVLAVAQLSSERERMPISIESASTVESEYNPNQFLMENFNFSFTSIPERTSTPETFFCRICHQRSLSEPNLSPCHCSGTMGFIHKSCLEQWLAASDSNNCELCHFNFTVKRQPKFGILKGIRIWMQSEECRTERLVVILDMIRLTISLPHILLINYLTAALFEIFHCDDSETCDFYSLFENIESRMNVITISTMKDFFIVSGRLLTYFIVGFTSALDVFCLGWFISRMEEHFQLWRKWYRTQCTIQVILPQTSQGDLQK